MTSDFWREQYQALVPRLPGLAQNLPLTLCGLATCTDAYLRLADAESLFSARNEKAVLLARALQQRAANGIGGELFLDWPEAEEWIAHNLPISSWGLGGTGAQAAQALAVLGGRALITLEDRTQQQLSVIHPDVLIATQEGLKKRSAIGEPVAPKSGVSPTKAELVAPKSRVGGTKAEPGSSKPAHYIFEFSTGEVIGTERVKRSTRVIVRFANDRLDRDPDFARESVAQASQAGAGVICGFNEVPPASLAVELEYTKSLLAGWRAEGLSAIHLELGGYEEVGLRDRVLHDIGPLVSSLGMSHSELREFGSSDIASVAAKLRTAWGLNRLCVHADTWALAVTNKDPERELAALMCGCFLAACRASAGKVSVPGGIPADAAFQHPPYPSINRLSDCSLVCCPAPYLEQPKATIGLGDTFLAGTLLVN
jgi:ADP-dependent phosphofructokinase/glucokinase